MYFSAVPFLFYRFLNSNLVERKAILVAIFLIFSYLSIQYNKCGGGGLSYWLSKWN